jgi:hypothetical protein
LQDQLRFSGDGKDELLFWTQAITDNRVHSQERNLATASPATLVGRTPPEFDCTLRSLLRQLTSLLEAVGSGRSQGGQQSSDLDRCRGGGVDGTPG